MLSSFKQWSLKRMGILTENTQSVDVQELNQTAQEVLQPQEYQQFIGMVQRIVQAIQQNAQQGQQQGQAQPQGQPQGQPMMAQQAPQQPQQPQMMQQWVGQ